MEARIQPSRKAREEAKARIQSDESETVKKRGKKAEEVVSKPIKNGKAKSEDLSSAKEVAKKKTIAVKVKKPLKSKTDDDIVTSKGKAKAKSVRRSRSAEPSSVFVVKAATKKTSSKDSIQEETEAKSIRFKNSSAAAASKKLDQENESPEAEPKKPASNSRAKKIKAAPKKVVSNSADSGEETDDEEPKKPAGNGRAKKVIAPSKKVVSNSADSGDESEDEEPKKPASNGRSKKVTEPPKKVVSDSADSGDESEDEEPKKPAGNGRAKKVIAPSEKAMSDSADSGEETIDEEPKKTASRSRAKNNKAPHETSPLDSDSVDESTEKEIKKPTRATAHSKKVLENSNDSGEESDDGDNEKPAANARSMKKAPPAKKVVSATKQLRGKKAAAPVKEVAVPNLSEESDTAEDATDEEIVQPVSKGATATNSSSIAAEESNSDKSRTDHTDEDALKPASTSRAAKKKISPAASSKDDAPAKKKARSGKAVTKQSSTESEGKGAAEPSTSKSAKQLLNNVSTVYSKIDFGIKEKFNLKITSWNVAGLRALMKKSSDYFTHEDADVVCLTEVKCGSEAEVPKEAQLEGYHAYWNVGKGGPGVGLLSKVKPLSILYDLPDSDFSNENRLITAEFEKFFLLSVYTVNSSRGLKNLGKRMEWNETFDAHVQELDKKKPVIIAGDLNVSHQEIDLANPKTNKKSAGFTQEERDGFTKLLAMGFVDTFRHFNPDTAGAYTYWTYLNAARNKNIGWRLDYFVASKRFMKNVKSNVIRSTVLGSDHCPIVLFLNL